MQENEFWEVIGKFNWDETGDDEAVLEPAIDFLSTQNISKIYEVIQDSHHLKNSKK